MGNKDIDIFRNLKNLDITPPKYLFKKIWSVLTNQQYAPELSVAFADFDSPADNNEEYSDAELEAFRSLQNHSIVPPSFSSLKIREFVDGKNTNPAANVFQLKYLVRAAAAVLIIVSGVWIVYNKSQVKTDTIPVIASTTPAANNVPVKSAPQPAASTNQSTGLMAAVSKPAAEHAKKIKAYQHLNTESGGLVDNDILLTLVNYNYSEYLPLLTEIKKNNRIKLGEFSYVNISDKMNTILQKMYSTKGNNKPTRKAKKLRATMEKWKKRDEKHFDAGTANNPLDIVDLSEFILK